MENSNIVYSTGAGLIPVHINFARDDNYFYEYDIESGKWVRGDEISEILKKCYKQPLPVSNYMKKRKYRK